jgi:hypothetical protein
MRKQTFSFRTVLTLALTAILFFPACEKPIDLDLEEGGGGLVIFSFLTPDSVFKVHLSRSVNYSSIDDFERVYGGYVKVSKNGAVVDSFDYPHTELWAQRPLLAMAQGDLFEIQAGDDLGNRVSGAVRIPLTVPIETLDTVRVLVPDVNGNMAWFIENTIGFTDVPGVANYYQLAVVEEVWQMTGTGHRYSSQFIDFLKEDPVFYVRDQEGSLLGGIDFKGTFPDELFAGLPYQLKIRIPATYVDPPQPGTKRRLVFMLLSQTYDYFAYLRSRVVAEYNYELPIVDPIKIHSNVAGGLGLLGGIAVSSDSLVFVAPGFH